MSDFECVTYATEAAAEAGALRNWINYVKEQVPLGKEAKRPDGTIITSLEGLTDKEIGELRILGTLEGQFVTYNGTTIAYTEVTKAYLLDLWYYAAPPPQYMVGVIDYIIQPFNPDWEPPLNGG